MFENMFCIKQYKIIKKATYLSGFQFDLTTN